MVIYLVKKQKGRIYRSEDIVYALFEKKLLHDEKGAPYIEGGFVSVSDTAGFWACAFSDRPVGIDIEEISRKVSPSAARKLHKDEREYLSALSEGSREWKEEFLSIWTKKESFSKMEGEGLKLGFSSFSVLGAPLYGSLCKGLVIGSTEEFTVEERSYDAPMKKTALEAGADILDVSGCSADTLRKKLIGKGYGEEETDEAVRRLTEIGFLNDPLFAESLARKYASKGYSSRRIAYELERKGVPEETASSEVGNYKDKDRERACAVAEKMAAGKELDEKALAKIARKLGSLGYDTSVVYDIIQRLR